MAQDSNLLSQKKAILAHLVSGGALTSIDALRSFGCFRLSARICELRNDGHNIVSEIVVTDKARYSRYFIQKKAVAS